jgi:hypothetical protein
MPGGHPNSPEVNLCRFAELKVSGTKSADNKVEMKMAFRATNSKSPTFAEDFDFVVRAAISKNSARLTDSRN